MKRLVMIFTLWAGMIGSAVAGPPDYDYLPEPSGMDFSTAPKPHIPVPGGEWFTVSGDGTVYPDIINYCDPKTSPECLAHLYMACWAWTDRSTTETGKPRLAPICKEAGVYVPFRFFSSFGPYDNGKTNANTLLYHYKLDIWKLEGMGYYYYSTKKTLPPVEDIPFKKNTNPDNWRGELAIDIYASYCRPDKACLANKGKDESSSVETNKSCPLNYCYGYGFQDTKKVEHFNRWGIFAYPSFSIAFPLTYTEEGEKYIRLNYLEYFYRNYRGGIPEAPARWLHWDPLPVLLR